MNELNVVENTDDLRMTRELAGGYPTNWAAGAPAAIVVRHLQSQGVDAGRMRAISAGQHNPRIANDAREGRPRSRRTEILLRPR
jgi:flagellar motor protein MotB